MRDFAGGAPSSRTVWICRGIAIVADAVQLALFPLFAEGFASVANDVVDVVVGLALTWLLGWNLLFLPSFVIELLPLGDLAPTWTIAVLIVTRTRHPQVPRGPGNDALRRP